MRFNQSRFGSSYGFNFSMTPAVKGLLVANAAFYVLDMFMPLKHYLGLAPREVIGGLRIWQLLTYMFLHDGIWHLVLNMFPLWMFGAHLERIWGRRTFLTYYFLSGIGGGLTYLLVNWTANTVVVGASGAVCGILLAFGVLFPNQVIYLFGLLPVKSKWFVTGYVAFTLLSLLQAGGGNIAHSAHLGGMVFGWIYLKGFTLPGIDMSGLKRSWHRWRMRSKFRVVPPRGDDNKNRGGNGSHSSTGRHATEVDKILDKITSHGLDSLTEAEQEALRQAGRKKP